MNAKQYEQTLVNIAAVITTAADFGGTILENMVYLAVCKTDFHAWSHLKLILAQAGLATFTGNQLTLTELGRQKAAELMEATAE